MSDSNLFSEKTLVNFVEGFYSQILEEKVASLISEGDVEEIIQDAEIIIVRARCSSKPSVFKRAAALCIAFVNQSPIREPIPFQKISIHHPGLSGNQNAIVILMYVFRALHGATCERDGDIPNEVLAERINPSRHQFADMVAALSTANESSFQLLSLLFEALAYKDNKDAQYQKKVFE